MKGIHSKGEWEWDWESVNIIMIIWVVGNPPCAGSTGGNEGSMPGPSGDWCAWPLLM